MVYRLDETPTLGGYPIRCRRFAGRGAIDTMKIPAPLANVALVIGISLGVFLIWYVKANYTEGTQWIPQFVVTLAGTIGAGQFFDRFSKITDRTCNVS